MTLTGCVGRAAQLGFLASLIGEKITGFGPLKQFGLETGIPLGQVCACPAFMSSDNVPGVVERVMQAYEKHCLAVCLGSHCLPATGSCCFPPPRL